MLLFCIWQIDPGSSAVKSKEFFFTFDLCINNSTPLFRNKKVRLKDYFNNYNISFVLSFYFYIIKRLFQALLPRGYEYSFEREWKIKTPTLIVRRTVKRLLVTWFS